MTPEFRLVYILEIILANVPVGLLRYYAFRHELRVPAKVFWAGFIALILMRIAYLNLANWPDMVTIDERQRAYLFSAVFMNLFFFSVIRPFWRHLFVFGVLVLYATVLLYPFAYLTSNEWLGQGFGAHAVGCGVLAAEILLTWKVMMQWVTDGVTLFFRYGTETFWRYFWLLPFLFTFSVVLFGVETARDNQIHPAVVAASLAGSLGLIAAFRFMRHGMEYLHENHVMEENLGMAESLCRVRLEKVRLAAAGLCRARRLQQEFGRCSTACVRHAENEDWDALQAELQNGREALKSCSGSGERPNGE